MDGRVGTGVAPEAIDRGIRRLHIYLIKPSKYDSDGYVIRYVRGVLPSNTLACLYSLTDDVRSRGTLGCKIDVTLIDEMVQRLPFKKIIRRATRSAAHTRTIIALAGVQTNQFPRACDIALRFRDAGITVMIGGFHVTGILALMDQVPEDIRNLIARGVTVVRGEVEEQWERLLADAVAGSLLPVYDFSNDRPDLYEKPVPRVHREYMRRFVFKKFGTIDAGRGCPFDCSFCTIINVQGRKMRHRSAACIENRIREDYKRLGIRFYFFTDDNFARNKNWEPILDSLIRLRQVDGFRLECMMQVDILAYRIPGFIDKARAAGCSNVFIGMESINQKNLAAVGKTQNDVEDFKNMIAAWHNAGILTHVGYIVGFPHDSPESVREDVKRLQEEVKVDLVSFFVLTPLPGSMDHLRLHQSGAPMEKDYNRYDSFCETMPHPNFRPGELEETYREAWRSFYGIENMKAVLTRAHRGTYWDIFRNYVWYKSALLDGQHPMISGFFRLKDRTDRRPGLRVEGRVAHLRRRFAEQWKYWKGVGELMLEMEEVWLQTRGHAFQKRDYIREMQHRVGSLLIQIRGIDYKDLRKNLMDALYEFTGKELTEYRRHLDGIVTRLRELDPKSSLRSVADQISAIQQQIDLYERLKGASGSARAARSRAVNWLRRLAGRTTTREPLTRFWASTITNLKRGRFFRINPLRFLHVSIVEARILTTFALSVIVASLRYADPES